MTDLVAAFVLYIFMLVLLCFLCCYRFSVNKDLHIIITIIITSSLLSTAVIIAYSHYNSSHSLSDK